MSTFIVGIDFGTAWTKAAVRELAGPSAKPEPVVLNENATGAAKYLLSSQSRDWDSKDPPKVKLLEDSSLAMNVETAALQEAVQATVAALRAAVRHVETTRGGSHDFLLQMGYPAAHDVPLEVVQARYELIAEEACRLVSTAHSVAHSKADLDERTAALVYLARANFELHSEPIFIFDGGGFTTHASIVRWRSTLAGYEPGTLLLGAQTVKHGVIGIVSQISAMLDTISSAPKTSSYAVSVMDEVMAGFLRAAEASPLTIDHPREELVPHVLAQTVWKRLQINDLDRPKCVRSVLAAFGEYSRSPLLEEAWEKAWNPSWEHDGRDAKYWNRYRLLMMGGACRIGRSSSSTGRDAIAARLERYQARGRQPTFTEVIYPEVDSRFWPEPNPAQELRDAMPYLFVACGNSIPFTDWPETLTRSPLSPPEKKEYEPPPGYILPTM